MKRLTIPIYDSTVYVIRTMAELDKLCDRYGIDLPSKRSDGICVQFDTQGVTQFILGWMCKDVSVLAHECTHLAHFILLRAGMDPRDSNAEAMAYLVGYIMTRVHK